MDFRTDGIPVGLKYAYKKGTDISTVVDLVAAPNSDQAIVVTDIIYGKEGIDGTLTIQDGSTGILDLIARRDTMVNFSGPLQLTAGNALKVIMSNVDTDYSLLVTYYIK